MRSILAVAALALITRAPPEEARLIRYPDYNQGRVAFTFLADIWVANEDGSNAQRLTVNTARDAYPRFSPDGKSIAFSSDRNGNLDVFIISSTGGTATQLTFHSADDNVLGWTPDGKSVVFSSNRGEDFMPKIYTVSVDGGLQRPTAADFGIAASFSPDGRKLAYNQKGQVYWRKFYRGSYSTDVMLADVSNKSFTRLTNFGGMDSWPMYGGDSYVYFVSDRDESGVTNIWRVSERGGNAEQVTSFKDGDVRWPSISSDRKTIVFEHNFEAWKLDVASRKVTPLKFNIAAETQENATEVREFNSQADDYSLAPSGRRIAISVHGEIFTVPTEDVGDLVQITDSPSRDQTPTYSPDGRWIAFVSDASGREEIHVISSDGAGPTRKITDLDALKSAFAWSPDSKSIAFTSSDAKLRVVDVETMKASVLAESKYGGIGAPVWSPDGKWIAFSRPDFTRTNDIYVVASAGGDEHRVTSESYSDFNPVFSPDGKKLYFIRGDGFGGGGGLNPNPSQLYVVTLDREEQDPAEISRGGADRADASELAATKDTKFDWAGLKRRTRQITRMPFNVRSPAISPNGGTIAFVTTEPLGAPSFRNIPVVYTMGSDGRRLTRLTAAGEADTTQGGGGGGGGFGGGNDLAFTRDGRTLYFNEGNSVYSVTLPMTTGAAAGMGASPAGPRAEPVRRKITFFAKVRIDRPAEWAEMFGDAWRTMKYRFYDPKMHGKNWDAARAKYEPLVKFAGDRQEVINLVNEMIGELDASHTGAAPAPGARSGAVSTGHLGVELTPDDKGRYRVTHIYEDGPADKDWVKVSVGDYLIAINGKQVKSGDDYWPLLNYRLNRKVEVTFNGTPTEQGAWKTRIEPASPQAFAQLRYQRWVNERKAMTEKLASGRVGYLHIQAMNPPSLRKFEKELRENKDKEALVIDQRWNGGGNIEQELLAILVQRQYEVWQPRGTESLGRPFAGFFGPKVVLQNWRSASNAEMFPAGFRALGLGKVIGTPTMGAVIGTGSYSLIDGSTVRTPQVGVYLADDKHTNMERYGVQPDILVENSPEDNLAGRDRQLEAAVSELLKQIGPKKGPTVSDRNE
jgi:tricorn protease